MTQKIERLRLLMLLTVAPLVTVLAGGYLLLEKLCLSGPPGHFFLDQQTGLMRSVPQIVLQVAVLVAIPVGTAAAAFSVFAGTMVLYARILSRFLSRDEMKQVFDEPFEVLWVSKYINRRISEIIGDPP